MPEEPLCGVLRCWQRLLREQGLGMRHATNINVDTVTKDPRVWTSEVLAGHVGGAHVGAGGDGHVDARGAAARGAEAGGDGKWCGVAVERVGVRRLVWRRVWRVSYSVEWVCARFRRRCCIWRVCERVWWQ
jgi:hypothetical protein